MYSTHELSPSRKDLRGSSRATTATLPAINKKALLNDTFAIPLKRKTTLTPLSNAPKTPKVNNFLASSNEQGGPLSLTFGSLELAITGGLHEEDGEGMNISHFVKTPEHKRCVQMLTEGFVESFVDFFYLTHKKDSQTDEENTEIRDDLSDSGSISLHDMPNDVLDFLMAKLSEAEDAQRDGDADGVVRAYRSLASHFEQRNDYTTAVHFHQKGLENSFRLGDSSHAADSYRCIGVDYEALGNTPLAIQYFDKYSELMQQNPNNKEAIAASFRHLVTAYRMFAEQLEEKAALDGSEETLHSAVEYYQKCLAMAKNCADSAAEGTVNYRLGLVYKQLDKTELSVKHLQNYLYLCRLNGDSEGESAACSALADAYTSSNDILQSVKYLEENINLAQRTDQPASQAHACRDLGIIYEQQEDYEKALEYFEKYYSLALASKDRGLVDNARVYLGIARGNIKLMKMFNIPNHSITPATMKPIPPRTGTSSSARPRTSNPSLRASIEQTPSTPSKASREKERKLNESGSRSTSVTPRETLTRPDSAEERRTRTPISARAIEDTDEAINAGLDMIRTPRTHEAEDDDEQSNHPVHTRNVEIPPIPMHNMTRQNDSSQPNSPAVHALDQDEDELQPPPTTSHSHRSESRPLTAHAPQSARSESARRPHTAVISARRSEGVRPESPNKEGTPRRPRTPSATSVEGMAEGERVRTPNTSHSEAEGAARVRTPTSSRKREAEDGKEVRVRTPNNLHTADVEERVRTPTSTRKGDVEENFSRSARGDVGAVRVRTPTSSRKGEENEGRTSSRKGNREEGEERVRTPTSSRKGEETDVRARTPTSSRKHEGEEADRRVHTPPTSSRKGGEIEERVRTPTSSRKGDIEENERARTPTSARTRTPHTPGKSNNLEHGGDDNRETKQEGEHNHNGQDEEKRAGNFNNDINPTMDTVQCKEEG